jgi:glucose-1-phosphate thymidylyltransferase
MSAAGIRRSVIVLRDGKWDIPSLLARADRSGIALAYVVLADSSSVVESLDAAFPFVAGQRVALGFPDILFEPEDAFRRAADLQAATGADVALALVPTDRPDKADIVAADPTGRVLEIAIKPRRHPRGAPAWTWVAAVWSPRFTAFLHHRAAAPQRGRELFPGQVFREALAEGFEIRAAVLAGGRHLDIGTPEDLERAIRESGVP